MVLVVNERTSAAKKLAKSTFVHGEVNEAMHVRALKGCVISSHRCASGPRDWRQFE
jgi:hypothetical protein